MEFSTENVLLGFVSLLALLPIIHGWGEDGHLTVCRIAQPLLSDAAKAAVQDLLPAYADNDLGSVCSWADHMKFRYHWSSALHYIDTPDSLCTYQYNSEFISFSHWHEETTKC
ncbi:hypothetical protein IFM89_004076 [Coptis chinensis]|uniref:Aspergillus nuclease S1 n=1 Tax=Coptis chinensis TaxID=261450 RepID=A0A835H1A8_9MAGN|nr:hypothetical protein IFM89_004076 [Coptis chinensis]